MNGKDIFLGLKYIGEDLIDEAESGQFFARSEKAEVRHLTFRKPFLIAALVGLMIFLMGCAVTYILKLDDMHVGEQEWFYDEYDYDTMEYLGRHYYTEQVFSAAGQEGSPAYQAAQEWFDFLHNYDPDRTIQKSVWGNYPEFPAEYDSYYLYTQEMKDKLDEIVQKFGLKLAGKELEFHNVFKLCDALGVEQSVVNHPDVLMTVRDGQCWENGNFRMYLTFSFRETLEDEVLLDTWGNLNWNRKECFSDDVIAFEDTGDWTQWYYHSSSGNEMLILRSPSDTRGWILCDRGDAILSVELETTKEMWNNVDGKTWAEELVLTDEQVEQIADAIDFGIQPRMATKEDVANQKALPYENPTDFYETEIVKNPDETLEFVTEPITFKTIGGYVEDAEENREYLYESWTVTSFTLGPNSATIVGCPVFSTPDEQLTVYMKDGSSALLYGKSTGNGASQLTASSTIDLTQVDYILLADGSKLPVPEH